MAGKNTCTGCDAEFLSFKISVLNMRLSVKCRNCKYISWVRLDLDGNVTIVDPSEETVDVTQILSIS